jgi:hypothetical protein
MATRWRRVPLVAVALCLALGVSPARGGWRIQRAQAIAAQVWHHPCDDHVTITWGDLVTPGAVAESYIGECRIVFSPAPTTWVEFCTTMIHEYGHLAGYRDWTNTADPLHSSNPHSVMAQNTVTDATTGIAVAHGRRRRRTYLYVGFDKRCADHGRTYLGMKPDGLTKREQFSYVG